jgi:hypothetical protein
MRAVLNGFLSFLFFVGPFAIATRGRRPGQPKKVNRKKKNLWVKKKADNNGNVGKSV